jgi:hypothetical protein
MHRKPVARQCRYARAHVVGPATLRATASATRLGMEAPLTNNPLLLKGAAR